MQNFPGLTGSLRALGLGVLLLPWAVAGPAPPVPAETARPADGGRVDHRLPATGVYMTASTAGSSKGLSLADQVIQAGGNAIIFDVKDQPGDLSYMSKVALARTIAAGSLAAIDRPAVLVDKLHQRGLHVVARLACFYDVRLATHRPDLVPRSKEGGLWRERGVPGWVDPSLPEVQQYLLDLAAEAAELGVDEIQLDYVRFPTEGNPSDAVFSFDPTQVAKHEIITEFVRRVRLVVAKRDVLLSADIFGVAAWGREVDVLSTGQLPEDLLPHLDVVSPMLYPSHFSSGFHRIEDPTAYPYFFVYEGCRRLKLMAEENGVAVRPWIQAFPQGVTQFSRLFVTEQMLGAQEGGAAGWMLWIQSNRYDVGLDAMERFANGTAGSGVRRMPPAP